ncbi:MAG: ECF-type sigma factor [Bryobacter sp.]|nr:ECF-type sigma factor [Bryobacter sp.]
MRDELQETGKWTASMDATTLLRRWKEKEPGAAEQLIPLVYEELRKLARRSMRGENGLTLQPTVLVNEAYLRMAGSEIAWQDRAHFFALSARLMKRILVDHARARGRAKRGGPQATLALRGDEAAGGAELVDVLDIERGLEKLRVFDARKADVLELHYFGGLAQEEIAEALGVSRRTVFQDLKTGKAWLMREFTEKKGGAE